MLVGGALFAAVVIWLVGRGAPELPLVTPPIGTPGPSGPTPAEASEIAIGMAAHTTAPSATATPTSRPTPARYVPPTLPVPTPDVVWVAGRVVGPGGTGVPGIVVWAWPQADSGRATNGRSGPDGGFEITGPPLSGSLRVYPAVSDGPFASPEPDEARVIAGTRDVRFDLRPRAALRVRVHDAGSGHAMPQATLALEGVGRWQRDAAGFVAWPAAMTGTLAVDAPGYAVAEAPVAFDAAADRTIEVRLARAEAGGVIFAGTAHGPDGTPLTAGVVCLFPLAAPPADGPAPSPVVCEVSPGGRFASAPLPPGRYRCVACAPPYAPARLTIELTQDCPAERLVLGPPGSVASSDARDLPGWDRAAEVRLHVAMNDVGLGSVVGLLEASVGGPVVFDVPDDVAKRFALVRISPDFVDTPVPSVLQFLADVSGLEFTVRDGVLHIAPRPPADGPPTGRAR